MIDGEVTLTLELTAPYIALMILIGPLMRMILTKLENIEQIIITDFLRLSPLCLLLLVRPLQTHGVIFEAKTKTDLVLAKAAALRITINIDDASMFMSPSVCETCRSLSFSF